MLVIIVSSHIGGYPGVCIALGRNLFPYTINPQAIFHITRVQLDRQSIVLYPIINFSSVIAFFLYLNFIFDLRFAHLNDDDILRL